MIFKSLKKQVECMLKMGWNNVYQAPKVNICNILHPKLDLVPKNLVEASFLKIYYFFVLVSITIDIPSRREWSQVTKWYWRFSPVSLVNIDLQKSNLHQMNYWKAYFLAFSIKNIQNVIMVGPRNSNLPAKKYGGPCRCWRSVVWIVT